MNNPAEICDLVLVDARVEDEGGFEDRVSIGIRAGKIVALSAESGISGSETIDAEGQLVTPGLIDAHVHFSAPGRNDWEGFDSGSRACVAGGITCFLDMPPDATHGVTSLDAFCHKRERGERESWVDFGLWGGLVPGNVSALAALHAAGAVGIKAFLCESELPDFPAVDMQTLREGMYTAAALGLRLALHAEHPQSLRASGPSAADFLKSRPPAAEYQAVRETLGLCAETGCPVHIVHVSCPETIRLIEHARREGIDVTCETCPHYLLLNDTHLDEIGPVVKCAPPLRPIEMVGGLVAHLQAGRIDLIASDHSPCPTDLKHHNDFAVAWSGISSVQHGFSLLQAARLLPRAELVERMSLHPARVFSLASKGRLAIGYDADIVIWDENATGLVHDEDLLYRHKHTPYTGHRTKSRPRTVFVRGQRVYHNGQFIGRPRGRFIRPGGV